MGHLIAAFFDHPAPGRSIAQASIELAIWAMATISTLSALMLAQVLRISTDLAMRARVRPLLFDVLQ